MFKKTTGAGAQLLALLLGVSAFMGCAAAGEELLAAPEEKLAADRSDLGTDSNPCSQASCREGFHCVPRGHAPVCVPEAESCVCPLIYAPICGADGQTYSNACVAACLKVQVRAQGACPSIELAGPTQEFLRGPPCAGSPVSLRLVGPVETLMCDPCVRFEHGDLVPTCAPGERCVAQTVVCVRAPCHPVAQCERS
jgi:hypothetical protein